MSSELLFQRLQNADQLPTAPGIALRIVELNQSDDVDIDQLAELIGQDPALAAKVIKTANSTMFGVPREVTNIKHAVMVLGLRTVNLLALSFSVIASTRGSAVAGFSYRRFWTQTASTASACRLLSVRVAADLKDEAFLTGLLAHFGQLVLAERAPELYKPVVDRCKGGLCPDILDVERELLGCSHVELGARLLDSWGLPGSVCGAIRIHRDPQQLESASQPLLARVANFGGICGDILAGVDLERSTGELRRVAARYFGLDSTACSEILTAVQDAAAPLARTLGLDLENDAVLGTIRRQATELLLRETLALHQQVRVVSNEMSSLERRARTDSLTGLRNRGTFDQELLERLERARRDGAGLGLLMIDLDRFKSVNDEHGHPVGDQLLRGAAAAIESALGPEDAGYRYGGEEFAVICAVPDLAALRVRAERVRESIGLRSIPTAHGTLVRTASLGGCFVPARSSTSAASLVEQADRLLYRAKTEGRDRSIVAAAS